MKSASQFLSLAVQEISGLIGRVRACLVNSAGVEITTFPVSGSVTSIPSGTQTIEGDVTTELTALQDQIVHYIPVKQIETWTISGTITGVITSITNTVTIAGAVTNTVLTAVKDSVIDALNMKIVDSAGADLIGPKTKAGSLPVTLASDEDDIGVKVLKPLINPSRLQVPTGTNPQELTLTAGCEKIWFSNPSANTATFYIGINGSVTNIGVNIAPGEEIQDFEVSGLSSIFVYATVLDEYISYQEFGRS